jgi:hypothetical protein
MKEESCKTQPIFKVQEQWDNINVFDKQDWPPSKFGKNTPAFYYTNSTDKGNPNKCGVNVYFLKNNTKNHVLAKEPATQPKSCDLKEVVIPTR